MMSSKPVTEDREAFVWIWLPAALEPVVAGRLVKEGQIYQFNYGRSYLDREDSIPIFLPELPLRAGPIAPKAPLEMAGCLRDASPDAWGRRVIINRLTGLTGTKIHDIEFGELTYMLNSGSDRIGALDFQVSASDYQPRETESASMEDLIEASMKVERGEVVPPSLERALLHGTSIGGARPKALIEAHGEKFIAKFSSTGDTFSVVKSEYVAMRLAKEAAALNVAPVDLVRVGSKDVLLIRRFDRERNARGWVRHAMVSALTLLGLHEMEARYASYYDLAGIIRSRFNEPKATLKELFGRMVFNVLIGNSDDHARNHAAYWNGMSLSLTPAYDLCPQLRSGRESNQAMLIHGEDRRSLLETCRLSAPNFLLTDTMARDIIDGQIDGIQTKWTQICDEAELGEAERSYLWRRQFLNDYALEGYARR